MKPIIRAIRRLLLTVSNQFGRAGFTDAQAPFHRDPMLLLQTFQSWQPLTRMNPHGEISIREVSLFDRLEHSPAFSFIGTRGALAAYLIEKDSAHWDCTNYFILDRGPMSRPDSDTRHWYVWRR